MLETLFSCDRRGGLECVMEEREMKMWEMIVLYRLD